MKDYRQAQIVRLDIIAQLYKRGYSYREIREEVMARLDLQAYSLQTVHKDVNRLLAEWRETRIDNTDLAVQLELERIDEVIKEAWAAWEKSKTDYERKKAKQQGIPGGDAESGEGGVVTVKMEQQRRRLFAMATPVIWRSFTKIWWRGASCLGFTAPKRKRSRATCHLPASLWKRVQ